MTKIKFFKERDVFVGFEVTGHTGYADFGEDVLCSAISSLTQGIVLGITKVCEINANVVKDDDRGYLKVELPNRLDQNKQDNVQVLLKTLFVSLEDLVSGYSNYISMEVIGNVY